MAKPRKNRAPTAPEMSNEQAAEPAETLLAPAATPSNPEPPTPAAEQPVKELVPVADPYPVLTVSLSAYRGGPSMHLQRSQRFNQMQIRFDGEQPGEQFLAMLTQAGWRDRTEAEGVWTKQIDKNGRWQSVDRMEKEFKTVANAIRQEKGMTPALGGMSVA